MMWNASHFSPLLFPSSHHKYSIHLGKGTCAARQPLRHRELHTVMTKMFLQPWKSCGSRLLFKIGMVVPREFVYYRALNPRQCYSTFCLFWGVLSNWWAPKPTGSDNRHGTCCLPWALILWIQMGKGAWDESLAVESLPGSFLPYWGKFPLGGRSPEIFEDRNSKSLQGIPLWVYLLDLDCDPNVCLHIPCA